MQTGGFPRISPLPPTTPRGFPFAPSCPPMLWDYQPLHHTYRLWKKRKLPLSLGRDPCVLRGGRRRAVLGRQDSSFGVQMFFMAFAFNFLLAPKLSHTPLHYYTHCLLIAREGEEHGRRYLCAWNNKLPGRPGWTDRDFI